MDLFLLILHMTSPVLPEHLLGSMKEAAEPAEPSNDAGLPKRSPVAFLALCSHRGTKPTD